VHPAGTLVFADEEARGLPVPRGEAVMRAAQAGLPGTAPAGFTPPRVDAVTIAGNEIEEK
jgi:hypothetical protein